MKCDPCKKSWSVGVHCPGCGAPVQKPHGKMMDILLWAAVVLATFILLALLKLI